MCFKYWGTLKIYIAESKITNFLGLQIRNYRNCKNHIDQMIPKLRGEFMQLDHCCILSMWTLWNQSAFRSIRKHEKNFEGNLSDGNRILTMEENIFGIVVGAKPRISCRKLFQKLEIVPFPSEYIFSLMNFITNNQEFYRTNWTHGMRTIFIDQFAHISCYHKCVHYVGIKVFTFKTVLDEKENLKWNSKDTHTFYSGDEFLQFKENS